MAIPVYIAECLLEGRTDHFNKYLTTVPFGPYKGATFYTPQRLWFTQEEGYWLDPDTCSFTQGDDLFLSTLGVFSINRTAHRTNRKRGASLDHFIQGAYLWLGLEREVEHKRLCQQVGQTEGVWATSSGRHAVLCAQEDRRVLEQAKQEGYGSNLAFVEGFPSLSLVEG